MNIFIVQENNSEFQGDTSNTILVCFYKESDAKEYIENNKACFIIESEIF